MKQIACTSAAAVVAAALGARAQTPSSQIDVMPGLALRLKAGALALNDGDPVLTWPNTADLSRSAIAGVSAPTYRTGIVAGKSAVRFSSARLDSLNLSGGGLTADDFTVFVVHQTNGDCCFLGSTGANFQIREGANGTNDLSTWDTTQPAESDALVADRSQWNVVEYRRGGPVVVFQEAGASRGHGPWATTATFDEVGGLWGNPMLDGDIAEILVFSRKLTIAEEVKVYDYVRGEYGIVPQIVPTMVVHHPPAIPKLYSYLHFQNAVNINFRGLPIDRTHVYPFFEDDVNPDLATFENAVSWRIPDPQATGYASLDLEVTPPGLLPWFARDYGYAPWTTVDRDYITSMLEYGRSVRPNVKWGVYWHPYYDTVALRSTTYDYFSTTTEWFEGYTRPGGLAMLLSHCDTFQPEVYPKDRAETQADSNFVAVTNVQLCRDINDYYVAPQVDREVMPLIWVQVVPYALGGGTPGQFLTEQELAQRFIAMRLSGADGVFVGGGPDQYPPDAWQQWADTTLTWALIDAGYVCYANCDGSTTAPVLNVLDFSCFLNKFASGDPWANCDRSTTAPVLNINDFACFLNAFAAGCT
jgi:hypothetical protein